MTQPPTPHDPHEDHEDHEAHEAHRTRVNLIAGVFILLLVLFSIWVVKQFYDQEQLQRCLDSRRTNCFPVEQRPSDGIRLPAH